MIVVDASALVAILLDEPEGGAFSEAILTASGAVISAVNYWEALAKAHVQLGAPGRDRAEALLAAYQIRIVSVSEALARVAMDAFQRYGRPNPGLLNMGDCFAYALAKRENAPLLYKGNDFGRTDVTPAVS